MTVFYGSQLRDIQFGHKVEKSTGTLAATTVALFTVTGLVAVTSLVGKVTTAVTVANSYKLQFNPTNSTTVDIFAATDIGSTDSPLDELIGFTGLKTDTALRGGCVRSLLAPLLLIDGQIESVSAGTDGVVNWILTWVPMSDSATVVAA
jgi:hypothetical protein